MSTEYLNYITVAGLNEEALAKEEGRKVTIKKVVIGLGLLSDTKQPQNQTALLQPKAETVCFVKAIDTEHGFYRIEADIPIPDIGYNYFEIGTLTETGILYSYARSRGDYVAGKSDSDGKLTRIRLNFRTDNSELITITQDDSVLYTPITDFEAHVEDDKAHEQYERKDNAATDAEIDSESQEKKHVKLPQFWRGIQNLKLTQQFQPYNQGRKYSTGEICYTKNSETGELSYWQWYSNIESLAGKDPLDLNNRFVNWSDTTKPPYWVPYLAREIGSTVWFGGAVIPEIMLVENNQDVPKAVYWRLALARPELVVGGVIQLREAQGRYLRAADGSTYLVGDIHEDAIRNIYASVASVADSGSNMRGAYTSAGGAIQLTGPSVQAFGSAPGTSGRRGSWDFNASLVVPTANQNQPVTMIEWKGVAI